MLAEMLQIIDLNSYICFFFARRGLRNLSAKTEKKKKSIESKSSPTEGRVRKIRFVEWFLKQKTVSSSATGPLKQSGPHRG